MPPCIIFFIVSMVLPVIVIMLASNKDNNNIRNDEIITRSQTQTSIEQEIVNFVSWGTGPLCLNCLNWEMHQYIYQVIILDML